MSGGVSYILGSCGYMYKNAWLNVENLHG